MEIQITEKRWAYGLHSLARLYGGVKLSQSL